MKNSTLITILFITLASCSEKKVKYASFEEFPTPTKTNLWLDYSKTGTTFKLWSPNAEEVKINLYKNGTDGNPFENYQMAATQDGLWEKHIDGDLNGTYYTYQVKIDGKWLQETPGIYAQAVGVNGQRAMILDLESTNPTDWNNDKGPKVTTPNDAIIYERNPIS